jgi:hypothetical protein
MRDLTANEVRLAMLAKGYRVFDDFNIVGVRASDLAANTFNDVIGVLLKKRLAGTWSWVAWPATTDPGLYYRERPMNVHGTAVLKAGQYPRAFCLGHHNGYPALQQNAPLTVYRDGDRNAFLELDETKLVTGMHHINLHRANAARPSTQVDRWSAGCQVIADPEHFEQLMKMAQANGGPFTYTLLDEDDFV